MRKSVARVVTEQLEIVVTNVTRVWTIKKIDIQSCGCWLSAVRYLTWLMVWRLVARTADLLLDTIVLHAVCRVRWTVLVAMSKSILHILHEEIFIFRVTMNDMVDTRPANMRVWFG